MYVNTIHEYSKGDAHRDSKTVTSVAARGNDAAGLGDPLSSIVEVVNRE